MLQRIPRLPRGSNHGLQRHPMYCYVTTGRRNMAPGQSTQSLPRLAQSLPRPSQRFTGLSTAKKRNKSNTYCRLSSEQLPILRASPPEALDTLNLDRPSNDTSWALVSKVVTMSKQSGRMEETHVWQATSIELCPLWPPVAMQANRSISSPRNSGRQVKTTLQFHVSFLLQFEHHHLPHVAHIDTH